jgi:hypothetical protein
MSPLFQTVARTHGVAEAQVRQTLGSRPVGVDLGVMLSFAVLYPDQREAGRGPPAGNLFSEGRRGR